jgi:hypothetical protein
MEMQTSLSVHDDLMVVKSMQDVEPILMACKEKVEVGDVGTKDMKHAATIPMVIIEAYMNRVGLTFQEFLRDKEHIKSMLNDKSLEGFRIWKGAV